MNDVLVITDLDGTLLNSEKRVTAYTAEVLNSYVGAGGKLTVATARMPYGCVDKLREVTLNAPAIVMNGAALYRFDTAAYTHWFPIASEQLVRVRSAIERIGAGAFVYAIGEDRQLHIGYLTQDDLAWRQYNSHAARNAVLDFALLGDRAFDSIGEVIYVAVVGSANQLAAVGAELRGGEGLAVISYRNVYTDTDCLEIASADAGKENALAALRGTEKFDELLVFGDNHNDLALMRVADTSFAPINAIPEARAVADVLVESNDDDGVARELARRFLGGADIVL